MRQWIIRYRKINIEELSKEYDNLVETMTINGGFFITSLTREFNIKEYNNIKAWRSSVIDGGEISFKKFRKVMSPNKKGQSGFKDEYNSPETPDSEKEISNLVSAYELTPSLKWSYAQKINTILGNGIRLNDFWSNKGKTRIKESEATHKDRKESLVYEITYCDHPSIDEEITKLFQFLDGKLKEDMTFKEVFILAVIFNLEFSRIHPFVNGNDKTSRILFERIFEENKFSPLIFASDNGAKGYKDLLVKFDAHIYQGNYKKRHDYKNSINDFLVAYETEHIELIKLSKKMK